MNTPTPVLLVILDGWGVAPASPTNAVWLAQTPNMDRWWQTYPATTLIAHNGAVGLPEGQMGNSEVGHLNIGAGRVVYQDLTRINRAIKTNTFFTNEVLLATIAKVKTAGTTLHLLGLLSDGGVHSHIDHLLALLDLAAQQGLHKVAIHAFMDGRDTPPSSGASYMRDLENAITRIGVGRVASVSGRFYAMDRDKRWDRVHIAWQALVDGVGVMALDPVAAVDAAYGRGETDEFIKPTIIIGKDGAPTDRINDGDGVLFFNFRADRARELSQAFLEQDFAGFSVNRRPALSEFVTFTQYDQHYHVPVAFPPLTLTHILGEEISRHNLRQLRIAETEKYAHVTYFFNGGREEPFPLEDRLLIPSPRDVATYDLRPAMSAPAVTDQLLARIATESYSLIVLNYANGDMVGHTGILAAAIEACETVDKCLGRLVTVWKERGGITLITADHGNAEIMQDLETGEPHTAHTTEPVPCILISDQHLGRQLRGDGQLCDIAPTILELQGLPVPDEMEGRSLLNPLT